MWDTFSVQLFSTFPELHVVKWGPALRLNHTQSFFFSPVAKEFFLQGTEQKQVSLHCGFAAASLDESSQRKSTNFQRVIEVNRTRSRQCQSWVLEVKCYSLSRWWNLNHKAVNWLGGSQHTAQEHNAVLWFPNLHSFWGHNLKDVSTGKNMKTPHGEPNLDKFSFVKFSVLQCEKGKFDQISTQQSLTTFQL